MMVLKDKPNSEVFCMYDDDLVLRLHNQKNLRDTRNKLAEFRQFLNDVPPSVEAAKSFLTRFSHLMVRTRYRYTEMIQRFMDWYGQPLTDVKVRVPRDLPSYIEEEDVEKILDNLDKKRSHHDNVERDRLLIRMAWRTGMRRGELAALCPGDIHKGFLVVRGGKGNKDRTIPLVPSLEEELTAFTVGMKPDQPVFNLTAATISNRIHILAERAGVPQIHTHSFRHKFATDLIERNANIRIVQELMGHENLNTTQMYLSFKTEQLFDAVSVLEGPVKPPAGINDIQVPPQHETREEKQPERSKQYGEIAHTRKVKSVAVSLAESLSIPSVLDRELWQRLPLELKPGSYYLPVGEIIIDENREILVRYPEISAGVAEPHLMDSLFSHLSTSGLPEFSGLTGESGEIKKLHAMMTGYSEKLMKLLKTVLNSFGGTGTVLNDTDILKPGLTRDFFITVWADAVQQAAGLSWINDSWYKPFERIPGTGLMQLKCGGFVICLEENEAGLHLYKKKHKELRSKYVKSTLATSIAEDYRQITDLVVNLRQRLLEFSDMKKVPGTCRLCE